MTIPQDPVTAVIDLLKHDPDIAGLCGTRVYGAKLPQTESANMPEAAIVVMPSGGGMKSNYSDFFKQRIDVRSYGQSEKEAGDVQMCAMRVLQGVTTQKVLGTKIYSIVNEAGRYRGVDPVTFWPFEFSVWLVSTHLDAA